MMIRLSWNCFLALPTLCAFITVSLPFSLSLSFLIRDFLFLFVFVDPFLKKKKNSMAILSFGISNPQNLAIANGVLVMLWGCLQLLLYFQVGFLAVSR
jgi:hypothetical protein